MKNFSGLLFCKRTLSILVLLSFTATYPQVVSAKGGSKGRPFRKLDNRPNPDDTDVWSFNLESNIYRNTVYLSPVVDYSSKGGWDVQIASYNIPVSGGGAQNFEWDSYINLSKTFTVNEQFKVLVGTQNGTTLFTKTRQFHNVEYGLIIYQPIEPLHLHAGPYWANKALTTTTDVVGYTAGFGLEIIPKKLAVQGDYFSGRSSLSGAVFNVLYRLFPQLQVYCGVGVPETHSGNEFYGALGFNLSSGAASGDPGTSTVEQ